MRFLCKLIASEKNELLISSIDFLNLNFIIFHKVSKLTIHQKNLNVKLCKYHFNLIVIISKVITLNSKNMLASILMLNN